MPPVPGCSTDDSHQAASLELRRSSSPGHLYMVGRQLQAKLNDAVVEVNHLKRRIVDLTNGLDALGPEIDTTAHSNKRRKITSEIPVSADKIPEIERLVRKFTTMYLVWVRDSNDNATFEKDPDPNFSVGERFENLDGKVQGQILDLHEVFPTRPGGLSGPDLFATPWFQTTFRFFSQQQRSNMAHRVRREAGPAIFNCTPGDLASPESRLKAFGGMIGLPGSFATGKKYSCFNNAALHKEYEGKMDIDKIFLNPILMRVLNAIIRGASSVVTADGGINRTTNAGVNAKMWNLSRVTPGSIAMSAVLARWALSPDEKLQEIGAQSNIGWQDDFESYLNYLISGLHKDKNSVRNIFKVWNEALFGLTTGQDASVDGRESNGDQEAMACLNADKTAREVSGSPLSD